MYRIKQLTKRLLLVVKTLVNYFDHHDVIYIIEGANWSTDWDGKYLMQNLSLKKGKVDTTWCGYRNKVIHLGAFHLFFPRDKDRTYQFAKIHSSNQIILTIFHVAPEHENRVKILSKYINKFKYIHTANSQTKELLVKLGLPTDKIVVIPLGVDINLLKPVSKEKKRQIREKLSIPQEAFVIGSFQKDGIGWGKGLEPKVIKGPDILCDVLENIAKKYNIFVLLSGPSRGYVKQRLDQANIKYVHKYIEDYLEYTHFFDAINMYLVTSRREGGPKMILEAMASGVPVVSTAVGMVPDIISHNHGGLVAEINDTKVLLELTLSLVEDKLLRDKLISNGYKISQKYDWYKIAIEYENKLYN